MAVNQLANELNNATSNIPNIQLDFNDTRDLLDIVDNLRSQGISRYIDLPEIIVCGEQSSGKSSVLEAISGLTFPSRDNLCTRFATELILRHGPRTPVNVRIIPGSVGERSQNERERLADFNVSIRHEDLRLDEIIESAKKAMGLNDTTKDFSSDILRLEVSGPEQPHLSLVDLPGLFQAGNLSQSDRDSCTVKSLVLSYMKRPRSIILAVVSAKNDFYNQSIARYARKIDKKGVRTLGIITKPDTLDKGSSSERFYVQLAQNKDVELRLRWHVLRNRDYRTRNFSLEERHYAEQEFFAKGVWQSLSHASLGAPSLKSRLRKILMNQITAQLPEVLSQIQGGIQESRDRLDFLGPSRATFSEQQRYLLQISRNFNSLVKAAVDGSYSDSYFGSASTENGYRKRLRAVIQNILKEFSDTMGKRGHTYEIFDAIADNGVDNDPDKATEEITGETNGETIIKNPTRISRKGYLSKVRKILERSRGRELPGTFDPLIVSDLFHEQRKSWPRIVDEFVRRLVSAVYAGVYAVLSHITMPPITEQLWRRFLHPRLEELTAGLRTKVDEIMRLYETGHPITYNRYLTANVQDAQNRRFKKNLEGCFEKVYGKDYNSNAKRDERAAISSLVKMIVSSNLADMDGYSCSTATDLMESYFKVARKKIVDEISVNAVETCLIEPLATLFPPEDMLDIDEEAVAAIAAEEEHSPAERARCNEKLKILQNGLKQLKSMQDYSLVIAYQSLSRKSEDSDEGWSNNEKDSDQDESTAPVSGLQEFEGVVPA